MHLCISLLRLLRRSRLVVIILS